ncbi:MAG TPA: response regulator, partial [Thermoguttaceae bacterium]
MASRVSSHEGKKTRILLLSEDPVDSRWLKNLLSPIQSTRGRHGIFGVSRVYSIHSALEALNRHHYEAVLVDIGLMTADQLEQITEIFSAAPHLPIIVLTSLNDDDLVFKAISLGAQECISKDTLNPRVLSRTLHQAIHRKKNETKLAGRNRELEAARSRLEQQAAELQQCMEQLDRINHELEDFAYIASHDLKEPLRGISSYCEILLEDYRHKMDADGKRRLTTVFHLCDRLENLIDDLLTYCRVGRKAQIKTRVNLNAVVANLLKMLRPLVERRNAVVQIAGPLPAVVGNATLIGMVLSN